LSPDEGLGRGVIPGLHLAAHERAVCDRDPRRSHVPDHTRAILENDSLIAQQIAANWKKRIGPGDSGLVRFRISITT